ncbi:MAG: hypothetical protein QHH14_12920 [Clostridiales bacterium]|nr:hypothetical protein [Clostridiales bacterium]
MKTKMIWSFVLFCFVATGPIFPQQKPLESRPATQPAQIDGQDEEWNKEALYFEKSARVLCAFQNDEENLYVLLVFEEPKSLSSIEATGITLSFNAEGKKKKESGIHFFKKILSPEETIAELEKEGQILTEEQKQSIRAKAGAIVFVAEPVKGKGQPEEAEFGAPAGLRPAFKTMSEGQRVVYEFRIPFAQSEHQPMGIGASPGQTIAVHFEWGGMTGEMRKAMQARARRELGGGIDKEGGAGTVIVPGREGGGAPGSGAMPIPKKYSFWVAVKLAATE